MNVGVNIPPEPGAEMEVTSQLTVRTEKIQPNSVNSINNELPESGSNSISPELSLFQNIDFEPYSVIISRKDNSRPNDRMHPLLIGKMLFDNKIPGVYEVEKHGRSKVRVKFKSAKFANLFIQNAILDKHNLKANIPVSNLFKQGIIRNAPIDYSEEEIVKTGETSVPIHRATEISTPSMAAEAANLIKCGICMERFNQDDHKPKFLQCYHTFCSHCLTKIQEKRSTSNGGGIEFPCPTCRKPTRVGKKGVAALQDNFYLFPLSAKAQEDEVYVSDDGEDSCRSTPPPDEASNSVVKVWCNKCLKVAGPECSLHDICNLELGRKRLYTRLQTAVEQLTHELDREVLNREPQLTHLRGAHEAWMSEVFEYLKDQINEQSMALTVARSELESVPSLSKLKDEPDPNIVAAALKKAESQLARSENHNKVASKQAALWSALQKCQINIHSTELPELTIDVTDGDSNQEKLLMYLLYYMLENSSPGEGNHSWQVIKAKGKEQIKSQTFKARTGSSLASTPAVSTESLSSLQKIKTTLNKSPGTLNKGSYCFFDISVDGNPHGRAVIHLRTDLAPKMCANFIALCTGELGYGYRGSKIFKTTNDHIVGGDFEKNDGTGGHSIYNNKGLFVADNCSLMDEKGAVRMRGMGTDSVGGGGMVGSQFHIWVGDRDFRPYRRTLVMGHVVEGLDLCKAISTLRTYKNAHGTYIIANSVVIQDCGKL